MKIGIISMQRIINYGSFLQAYSLKKIIEQLGHNVLFIDYHIEPCIVPSNQKNYNIFYKMYKNVRKYVGYTLSIFNKEKYLRNKQKKEFFNKFKYACKHYLNITDEYHYQVPTDVLIIGSDEVFNCLQTNADVGYSLELFGKNHKSKKLISYAASFGNTTLNKLKQYNVDKEISQLLNNFDCISVRDNNSKNIIENLTDKIPFMHLDPVFIYDYTDDIPAPPDIKDYIIVYAYANRINEQEAEYIINFAKKHNKKLICLGNRQNFCHIYIPASPFEVLSYFKNADYIITDTFHGSVFSIKYNIPFAVIIRESINGSYGNSEKLNDLINKFSFNNRIVKKLNELESILSDDIDFTNANKIIEDETNKSINYLKKWLA